MLTAARFAGTSMRALAASLPVLAKASFFPEAVGDSGEAEHDRAGLELPWQPTVGRGPLRHRHHTGRRARLVRPGQVHDSFPQAFVHHARGAQVSSRQSVESPCKRFATHGDDRVPISRIAQGQVMTPPDTGLEQDVAFCSTPNARSLELWLPVPRGERSACAR